MSQDLVLSAPLIYNALFALLQETGQEQTPPIDVFPFEVGQYEPGTYVMVTAIENHSIEWETLGYFSQIERYDITGKTSVFTGSSPSALDSSPATDTITAAYAAHYAMVMTPLITNRSEPILGVTPSPYIMIPTRAEYSSGPGEIGDGPGGWEGTVDWTFHFETYLTPA